MILQNQRFSRSRIFIRVRVTVAVLFGTQPLFWAGQGARSEKIIYRPYMIWKTIPEDHIGSIYHCVKILTIQDVGSGGTNVRSSDAYSQHS